MSNAAEDHTVGHPRLTLLEAQVKNWMIVLKWKITPNERKLILEGPISTSMIMGGRVFNIWFDLDISGILERNAYIVQIWFD